MAPSTAEKFKLFIFIIAIFVNILTVKHTHCTGEGERKNHYSSSDKPQLFEEDLIKQFSPHDNPRSDTFYVDHAREESSSNTDNSFSNEVPMENVRQYGKKIVNIGIVGDAIESEPERLRSTLNNINRTLERYNITLNVLTIPMRSNPLEMSKEVCSNLIKSRISVIIVENIPTGTSNTISTISISLTCGLYGIPVIGTDDRDSGLSNKNIHPSFLRVIPPLTHQADAWMDMVASLSFNRVVVITTTDDQGILSRLSDLIDQRSEIDLKIESLIEFEPLSTIPQDVRNSTQIVQTKEYLISRLTDILNFSICRVFLIHTTDRADLSLIFEVIRQLNIDRDEFVLILSEAALVSATETANHGQLLIPSGSISTRLKYYNPVDYKIDALKLIMKAILLLASKNLLTDPPNSCDIKPMVDWVTGIAMYNSILRQRHHGLTGFIVFNELGDRIVTSYDILNIITRDETNQINVVGSYSNGLDQTHASNVTIRTDEILWPGGGRKKPTGIFIEKHLKIVTLQERPFVLTHEGKCPIMTSSFTINSNRNDNYGNSPPSTNTAMTLIGSYIPFFSSKTNDYEASANSAINGRQYQNYYTDTLSEMRQVSIPCKKYNRKLDQYEDYCCEGYCMDILDEISRRVNFSYEVYIVEDNQYGAVQNSEVYPSTVDEDAIISKHSLRTKIRNHQPSDSINGQEHLNPLYYSHHHNGDIQWNGLIGELVSKRADMAFAPLSVTAGRAQVIDFSKPFKFHGFSILLLRASMHTTLASFLQPFHKQLWVLVIGVATHVVALSLYLLDRYSTFGRFGMKKNFISSTLHNKHDEHPLHLSSSIWFSWSILLNSGIGEHTPKSLSGRVLGMFWSGFAMIVVASYTANLAAFLVLREEQISISGIDDPRLRSGDSAFSFATVRGSAVDAYLQSQVEYINLYRKMEEFNFDNVDDAVDALKNGTIDALIWDSTRLEWETSHDEKCSLGIAGELFGRSGYGIGLQKNSYWTNNVTTKLLELHESGFMMDLDRKWILSGTSSCDRKNDDYPETLGISNIAGVFILFACGLVTSFGLIIIERKYVNYRKKLKLKSRTASIDDKPPETIARQKKKDSDDPKARSIKPPQRTKNKRRNGASTKDKDQSRNNTPTGSPVTQRTDRESFVIDNHGPDGPNITSSLSENLLNEVKSLSMNTIHEAEGTADYRSDQLNQNITSLGNLNSDGNDQQINVCEDINDRIGPIRHLLKAAKHQQTNKEKKSEEKLKKAQDKTNP